MSKSAKAAAVPREQEWLNGAERARLQVLVARIQTVLDNQVTAGRDLAEIRDTRLYREAGATFEDFCKQMFGLSRARLYQLMSLVEVREIVSTTVDTPTPETERVARELAPLRDQPEAMREAWEEAVQQHGDSPTAAQVRDVVRGPGGDIRFSYIENAIDGLRGLPALGSFPLPVEAGDIEAMDAAVKWMDEWWPQFKRAWKCHKAELKSAKAHLRSVA